MKRRWVGVALGGLITGIAITLIGLSDSMEHLRWPGALAAFILGSVVLSVLGLEGGPALSPAQSIILNTIFFVANIAFWGIPAMILVYLITRTTKA